MLIPLLINNGIIYGLTNSSWIYESFLVIFFNTSFGKSILCGYNINININLTEPIQRDIYEKCGSLFPLACMLAIIIPTFLIAYIVNKIFNILPPKMYVANIFINVSKNPDLIDTCVICLENFATNSSLAELNCGHNYHFNCLDKWIKIGHKTCPLCRLSIKSKIH